MKILYTLCALLLFISCNNDDNTLSTGKIEVAFSVTLPEPEEVLTRAYSDKDIENITVLVFDHANKFMERIDVDKADITLNSNGIAFNVIVDATPDNRTLHLIANARTPDGVTDRIDFSGVSTTKTEAQIIPQLATKAITGTTENALLNDIAPLIMWSRVALNGVNITTTVNDVKLLRSVACVTVKKDDSSSNGLGDLVIEKMTIHKGIDRGYVAPSAYTANNIVTPSSGNPYTTGVFDYTKAWSVGAQPVAYIYERNCSETDYMSIILQAKYKGQSGYYKIALVKNGIPVNIVRNHRYKVTILSVDGLGYSTAATAAESAPSNALKVKITDDTEDFPYVQADSQYWIGLSCNQFQLLSQTTSLTGVELCTVYSSRGITPTLTASNPSSLSALAATAIGGNKYKITGTFSGTQANNTLTVRCDNLSLNLDIHWSALTAASGYNGDTDSYAINGAGSLENWKMWIPNLTTNKYIHLHPSSGNANALTANTGNGMVTELTGKYGGNAYVHIHKGTNRKDEFWTTSYSGSTVSVRKTVVAQ